MINLDNELPGSRDTGYLRDSMTRHQVDIVSLIVDDGGVLFWVCNFIAWENTAFILFYEIVIQLLNYENEIKRWRERGREREGLRDMEGERGRER